jgi:hypothetical protein
MKESNSKDPNRPKRIATTARETSDTLDHVRSKLVEVAQNARIAEEKLRVFADSIERNTDFPELGETEFALGKFQKFVQARARQIETQPFDFSAPVLSTTASTAVSSIISFGGSQNWGFLNEGESWPTWWNRETVDRYAKILDKVNEGLGRLLLAAWDALYTTRHEKWRSVLTQVRELFNQFFECDKIATDEEVRASKFFDPERKGKKSDKEIWKEERLRYVINEKITDRLMSESLESQVGVILKSYEHLNRLHTRGEIDEVLAKAAFVEILSFLKQFIDAIVNQGDLK